MKSSTGQGSMLEQIKLSWIKILVVSGLFSFFLHIKKITPLLLVAALFAITMIALNRHLHRLGWQILFPFSSGLMGFLCKYFYWDRFDWIKRMEILLLISSIFSLLIMFHRLRLIKKFLLFFNRLPAGKRLIFIFIFSQIVFIIASFINIQKKVGLVGDEPHYLVIAQSLARDFDLNVFNQYAREEYREFIDQHLQPHARVGKGFKRWYSFHLPGLAVTLAPFFVFRFSSPLLYFLVRSYLGLYASLLAVLVYMFSLKIWKSRSLALWITLVFCFTSPIFFLSIHVFAEIQVLLLLLSSIYFLFFAEKKSNWNVMLAGLLLGIAVFWGMKYVIFIYFFTIGCFVYFLLKKEKKKAFLFILFPLLFQLLFFSYLLGAYGNLSPLSIYTGIMTESQASTYYDNVKKIAIKARVETLLDYFFDQRDGLLPYNLFYFFFFPGLLIAFKKIRTYSPHLLFSAASFFYLIYHGFSTVRPGVCPQARYMVPIMWTLMIFSVIYYRETRNWFFKKIFLSLPVYSISVVVYQIFHPFTLYQSTTHDYLFRPGLMFQKLSNIHINLPELLPSFIKNVPSLLPPFYRNSQNENHLPNIIFLLIFSLLLLLSLISIRRFRLKFFPFLIFVIFLIVFVLFPRPPLYNPVLIEKAGTIPYLIHGVSFQPKKMAAKKFSMESDDILSLLISTREKIPFLLIEAQNKGKTDASAMVNNFDYKIQYMAIGPSGIGKIVVRNPRFRKLNNRFYYQFTIQGKNKILLPNDLVFELYPLKKLQTST